MKITAFDNFRCRRVLPILAVACLSFLGSWLFAAWHGVPIPTIHDESSYLLAADTFAHGRITNPPHPLWEFFETFHVLQQPTYMSIYPPGQGIFLAAGQVLFGHPVFGVWLSAALMCAAFCWMLYAWVPARWAFIGGIVAAMQYGIFTYWSQSYWGGAVAALGGALVFGSLPRMMHFPRTRDALWLGLGIALLAITRPLEGLLIGLPLGCLLLPWKIRRHRLDLSRFKKRILLPLGLMMVMLVIAMGFYNKTITGNVLELPRLLYEKQYVSVPLFLWQPLKPPIQYHHKEMSVYAKDWTRDWYMKRRHDLPRAILVDGRHLLDFYFGFILAIPALAVIARLLSRRKTAWRLILTLAVIIFMLGMLRVPLRVHYIAPFTSLAVLLITTGLRLISAAKFNKGRFGISLVAVLIGVQLVLDVVSMPVRPAVKSWGRCVSPTGIDLPPEFSQDELKNILIKRGGKYLAIVRYPPWHNFHNEWVYNAADIDHAPVVWARDMGEARNAKLLEYFKDRQVLYVFAYRDLKDVPFYSDR